MIGQTETLVSTTKQDQILGHYQSFKASSCP